MAVDGTWIVGLVCGCLVLFYMRSGGVLVLCPCLGDVGLLYG